MTVLLATRMNELKLSLVLDVCGEFLDVDDLKNFFESPFPLPCLVILGGKISYQLLIAENNFFF